MDCILRRFTGDDWVTLHDATWRRWLGPLIGAAWVRGLEIGCHEGRSTCWFCDNVLTGPNAELVCVDPWVGPYSGPQYFQTWATNTAGLPIHLYRMRSDVALARMRANDVAVNFAYIDGSHEGADVLSDMVLVWQMLTPAGIMICDDYGWRDNSVRIPPKPAIDAWIELFDRQIADTEFGHNQVAIWKK